MDEATTNYYNTPTPVFGPNVKLSNGNIMAPKSQTYVKKFQHFSKEAQYGYIFDDLATDFLISMGQLCNDYFIALFLKYNLKIIKNNMVIIEVRFNQKEIWDIPLTEIK